MFEGKNALFIAEYSKENIMLAEELCVDTDSIAVFWENEDLKSSKNNYFDMLDISNDLSDNFFIVSENKESENFILIISELILKSNSDYVITKGNTVDIWPISLIKSYFSINHIPFVAVLEGLDKPEKFDITTLKPFDFIFGLGPSCIVDEFEEKTEVFSEEKEYSLYKNIQSPVRKSVLFLCNKQNIKKLSKSPRLQSDSNGFVDPKYCPDEELCILLNLAEIVIDESEYEESKLILSKMGKKSFSLKEFLEKNYNLLIEEENNYFSIQERKKVFFTHLKKEIKSKLEKLNYSLKIEGSTIGLGD